MSDWRSYENEGIILHEFGNSDHRVPHEGSELVPISSGGFPIILQNRIESNVGKSINNGGLKVKAVIRAKEETTLCPPRIRNPVGAEGPLSHASRQLISSSVHSMSEVHDITGLTAQYGPIPNNIFKQWNVAEDLELIVENTNFATVKCTEGIDFYNFSVDNTSLADNGIELLGNDKDREDELLYTDWHDISNLEEFDKILRNCDSTFGQGSNMESQSRFSSSTGIYGLDDTFCSGLPSSTFELRTSNSVSSHPNSSYLSDNGPVANDTIKFLSSGYQSFEMITDAEQILDSGRAVRMESSLHPVGNEASVYEDNNLEVANMQMKHLEAQNMTHLEGKNQLLNTSGSSSFGYVDQKYLSPVSASPDSFPVPLPTTQNHLMYSESSSPLPTFKSQFHARGIGSLYVDGFTQAASDMQLKKMGEVAGLESSEPSNQDHKQLSDSNQRTGNDRVHMNIQLAGTHMDASVTQNSYLPSVYSDDMSVKAVTFKQLQDVMAQLDVRTKLSIRDSLYRLARSAEQRHNISFTSNGNRECRGGVYNRRKLNDSLQNFSVETETNPIDRSIAHLLFHRPSEIAPRSDDAILLEPQMISNQRHGSIAQIQ